MLHRLRALSSRISAYLSAFGAGAGLRTLATLSAPGALAEIRLPGHRGPLFIRRGTSDEKVFDQVFVLGDYEMPQLEIDPRVIVDGGANTGLSAVYFARAYPDARILAIEPDPANFELLRRNVAPYPAVTPIRAALWNRPASLAIANPGSAPWEFQMQETTAGGDAGVRALTIPELLDQAGAAMVDLLKLDIEGAERELFDAGADAWIRRVAVIAVETHDRIFPGSAEAVRAAAARNGFAHYAGGENDVYVRTDAGVHLTVPEGSRIGAPHAYPTWWD